ncbi:hypothetical protein F2Q70_00044146 [Brassica cretica]|uniref:Uncharacterized protein n=1 Tax=Brassica cretica TaxID=69181 RepID=A0A8S9KJH2_BRACR|nr:hypothetical protein F2Q70_00044146 [Brassica cretica]
MGLSVRNKLKPKASLVSLEHERDPRSESRRSARRVAAVTASASSCLTPVGLLFCVVPRTSRCEGISRIKAELSLADLSRLFSRSHHFPCSLAPTVGLVCPLSLCRISCVAWPVGEPICTAYA